MKLFGDISEHEKSTADGLTRMEKMLLKKKISSINKAKGYMYIISHWYALGMEEEGLRLFNKVEEICPEYLRKHLKKHMKDDEKYNDLIINLFTELAFLLVNKPIQFVKVVEK